MRLIKCYIILLTFSLEFLKAQHANYISNGGFEELIGCCNGNPACNIKFWNDLDSMNNAVLLSNSCLGNFPNYGFGFQYPHSGYSFVVYDFFCPSCQFPFTRTYAKNRLKSKLTKNQTYCVKFWVNIGNNSGYGIDAFDAYFSSTALDTVTKKHLPITFVNAQVKNPVNNIVTDTLKWTPITGTFTADGSEKFLIIGDFRTDAATNKQLIVPVNPNFVLSEICLDDVSCIPIDLPAAAGPDRRFLPGEKIYLGRERDVEIDESCLWYKLPNMLTPIDTGAGIFVSPTQTSTYVVRQQLWCSGVKYDTVVVYQDFVGIPHVSSSGVENDFRFFPNPASNKLYFEFNDQLVIEKISIIDILGKQCLLIETPKKEIDISSLQKGLYYLNVETNKGKKIYKLMKE